MTQFLCRFRLAIAGFLLLLAGCGGGGGDQPVPPVPAIAPPPPAAPPPVAPTEAIVPPPPAVPPPAAPTVEIVPTPPPAAPPPVAPTDATVQPLPPVADLPAKPVPVLTQPPPTPPVDPGQATTTAPVSNPAPTTGIVNPPATAIDNGSAAPADAVYAGYAAAQLAAVLEPDAMTTGVQGAQASRVTRQTLYVSTSGSDDHPGTSRQPFRTIARAARAAAPGTKVLIAPGTYTGGFRTNVSGEAGARIAFISSTKWGARIVPASSSPNKTAWDNRGDHIDIIGFEIDGSAHQSGVRWAQGIYSGGSHVSIRHNQVHHIAQANGCDRAGGAAIGVDSYYGGVNAQVISNLVHDIGPAGCRFVQGIYVSTSGQVRNNVIYRVAEGGVHLWHDARDVIITNNTVSSSNTGIIVGGGDFYRSSQGADNVIVNNNIVFDNVMGISEQGKTGLNNIYHNNLVYQNAHYDWRLKNGLRHSATVNAAPDFVAGARSARPNLKLNASSPAIGRGTSSHADGIDFEGKPRNASAGYDIGAYQHR